jgi:hypothetical protein
MSEPARPLQVGWSRYRRARLALWVAFGVALVGWAALWFRSPWRWVAFVVWGAGCGSAVILAGVLSLWPCPRCGRRGFGTAARKGCPHCGARPG